jgi:hypothetical protein
LLICKGNQAFFAANSRKILYLCSVKVTALTMHTQVLRFTAILFLSGICFISRGQTVPASQPQFPQASSTSKSNLTYTIINSANHTYGYDIFSDGKLLIHQPSVPGMSGNEGFKSKQSSEKVAQLVINKVKKGEMPPTVTKEELQKLNAIK